MLSVIDTINAAGSRLLKDIYVLLLVPTSFSETIANKIKKNVVYFFCRLNQVLRWCFFV